MDILLCAPHPAHQRAAHRPRHEVDRAQQGAAGEEARGWGVGGWGSLPVAPCMQCIRACRQAAVGWARALPLRAGNCRSAPSAGSAGVMRGCMLCCAVPRWAQVTAEKARLRRRVAQDVRAFTRQALQELRQQGQGGDGEFLQGEGGGEGRAGRPTGGLGPAGVTVGPSSVQELFLCPLPMRSHCRRRQLGGGGTVCGPLPGLGQVCARRRGKGLGAPALVGVVGCMPALRQGPGRRGCGSRGGARWGWRRARAACRRRQRWGWRRSGAWRRLGLGRSWGAHCAQPGRAGCVRRCGGPAPGGAIPPARPQLVRAGGVAQRPASAAAWPAALPQGPAAP